MNVAAWIQALPPDAIASVVRAYEHAEDDANARGAPFADVMTEGSRAFREALLSLAPTSAGDERTLAQLLLNWCKADDIDNENIALFEGDEGWSHALANWLASQGVTVSGRAPTEREWITKLRQQLSEYEVPVGGVENVPPECVVVLRKTVERLLDAVEGRTEGDRERRGADASAPQPLAGGERNR